MAMKTLTTCLKRLIQAPPPEPPGEGRQFGGDAEIRPSRRWQSCCEPPQQLFTTTIEPPGAVGISGIDQAKTRCKGLAKGLLQKAVIPFGVVPPPQLSAPGPGADSDAVQRVTSSARHDRLH